MSVYYYTTKADAWEFSLFWNKRAWHLGQAILHKKLKKVVAFFNRKVNKEIGRFFVKKFGSGIHVSTRFSMREIIIVKIKISSKNRKSPYHLSKRGGFSYIRWIIELKHLNQNEKRARPHRWQEGEKLNRVSQKQASKGILFCGVLDAQTGHSPHRHRLQRL